MCVSVALGSLSSLITLRTVRLDFRLHLMVLYVSSEVSVT